MHSPAGHTSFRSTRVKKSLGDIGKHSRFDHGGLCHKTGVRCGVDSLGSLLSFLSQRRHRGSTIPSEPLCSIASSFLDFCSMLSNISMAVLRARAADFSHCRTCCSKDLEVAGQDSSQSTNRRCGSNSRRCGTDHEKDACRLAPWSHSISLVRCLWPPKSSALCLPIEKILATFCSLIQPSCFVPPLVDPVLSVANACHPAAIHVRLSLQVWLWCGRKRNVDSNALRDA
ncbi:hypothetical protein IWZ01DRAFT_122784 [Phyllosticta capitalensis]